LIIQYFILNKIIVLYKLRQKLTLNFYSLFIFILRLNFSLLSQTAFSENRN